MTRPPVDTTRVSRRDFMRGADSIDAAITAYVRAVKDGSFPAPEHAF